MAELRTDIAVLVTGASGGIGRSCVQLLSQQSFTVFALVKDPTAKTSLTNSPGDSVIPVVADVRDARATAKLTGVIAALCQRMDKKLFGLVNCAGVSMPGALELIDPEDMLDMLDINVVGQLRVVQACLPLLSAGDNRIVMIGSTSGSIPSAFTGAYCASKFALEAMTRVLRAELWEKGIRVSIIDPGMIRTRFWDKACDQLSSLAVKAHERAEHDLASRLGAWNNYICGKLDSAGGSEAVARHVLHALTTPFPKSRYVVGRDAYLKLLVWQYLPESLQDVLVRKLIRKLSFVP